MIEKIAEELISYLAFGWKTSDRVPFHSHLPPRAKEWATSEAEIAERKAVILQHLDTESDLGVAFLKMENNLEAMLNQALLTFQEARNSRLKAERQDRLDKQRQIEKARRRPKRYIAPFVKESVLSEPECRWCGIEDAEEWHVDHIHPVMLGGKNSRENLAKACAECNLMKSAKTLEEWLPIAEARRKSRKLLTHQTICI